MDSRPPGPFVHGIPQARILKRAAVSSSRASSWPRDDERLHGSAFQAESTAEPPVKSQSCSWKNRNMRPTSEADTSGTEVSLHSRFLIPGTDDILSFSSEPLSSKINQLMSLKHLKLPTVRRERK